MILWLKPVPFLDTKRPLVFQTALWTSKVNKQYLLSRSRYSQEVCSGAHNSACNDRTVFETGGFTTLLYTIRASIQNL